MTIGRRSRSRGTAPDIDLADLDPGVSTRTRCCDRQERLGPGRPRLDQRHHARRRAARSGRHPVPLPVGAVIRLGAWTTITLTAHPPADPAPRPT